MGAVTISDWTKLGAVIRDTRTRRGLTQGDLAESADVSRSWLAKVESGHRRAEVGQILRLLSALDLGLLLQASDNQDHDPTRPAADTSARHATLARHADAPNSEDFQALAEAHSLAASRRRTSWNSAMKATKGPQPANFTSSS